MGVNAKVYFPQGAEEMVVDSGGRVTVKSGGVINIPFLTPVKGAKATLTTGTSAGSNEVTVTAKVIGKAGNGITVAYVADDDATEASVAVEGTAITVTCKATEGTVTSTAAEIAAAITGSAAAAALVAVEGDGTSAVTGMESTPLEGGKDTTPAKKGDICFDTTNLYIALDDIVVTDAGTQWKKVAWTASI